VAQADPSHPCLLILNDPLQHVDSLLLAQDLLLELIQTSQDHPHVDANLINVLPMTINTPRGVFDLLLVIIKRFLFGNNVGPKLRLQSIVL